MEKYWQRLLFKWFLISYLAFMSYLVYQKFGTTYLVICPVFLILAFKIYKIEVRK